MSKSLPWFRKSLLALLAGSVCAILITTAISCSQSGCLADCESGFGLEFDSPIGQPGSYTFTIGSQTCSMVLPAWSSCMTVRDFAVVGIDKTDSQPPRSLHVTVTKDGAVVMDGDATQVSYGSHDVCGSTCTNARFSMAVPSDLVRPLWGPCDQAKLTGTYAVNGFQSGSCDASLFNGPTLTLASGLLQMNDSTCSSQLTSWSPDTCKIQSTAGCTSTLLDVTWNLSLTDVMGDGSRLLGYGDVATSAPVTCQGSSSLELLRQ